MGYIDGRKYSTEEIATRTGIPVENVDTMFERALRMISLSPNRDKIVAYDANLGVLINYYEQKIEETAKKLF